MFFVNVKKKKTAGFTLIEMMVAVAIFSLVMMVALSAVLSMVSANKKGQAISSVINNLNFALESMNRDLRTGSGYQCPGLDFINCKEVFFYSLQYDGSVSYIFDQSDHTILRKKIGEAPVQMISDEVYIEDMNFSIAGYEDTDGNSPTGEYTQAIILLTVRGCASASRQPTPTGLGECDPSNKDSSIFNIQTLLTQRELDI